MNKGSTLHFALKLYGKSCVAGLLAFILNIVVLAAYETLLINIFVLAVSLILLCVLVYGEAWEQGYSDINRDKNERKTPDMLKGLKAALLASIPIFLLTVMLWLVKFGVLTDGYLALYRLFNSVYQPLALSFLPATLTGAEVKIADYLLISLTSLSLPIVAAPAYYLGYKGFVISSELLYIKKK